MKLLPKIAQGDVHALELLYAQQKTKVYRLILSMTGDAYLAEDITQETFLRVQEQAKTYRNDGSEAAWVITIARNLTYDTLRRRKREVVDDEAALSGGETFSDGLEQSNLVFLDLIKELPQPEKEVICLRILAGLSWREIGKMTGQSADASRKRYVRALTKLRSQL